MTAVKLGDVNAPQHAVIGSCNTVAVYHVGLLAEKVRVTTGQASVHHMGPPMELPGQIDSHVAGWLDDLSDDERTGIDDWLAEVRTRLDAGLLRGFAAYVAAPSVVRDTSTGRMIAVRYSCAGFVAEAYREGAGVTLVVDDGVLPAAERDLLERVWGVREVRAGARFGLEGLGPWRVLLPGYLLHAMRAGRTALPYSPSLADALFP